VVGGELRWEMKGKNTGKKRKSLKNPRVDLESFDVSETSVTSSDSKYHNSSKGEVRDLSLGCPKQDLGWLSPGW
jgi:hypothetical protein